MSSQSFVRTAAIAAAMTLGTACHHYSGPVPAPDLSTVKTSEHGLYRASVRTGATSIPIGRMQSWTLHIETPAGVPVDSAAIVVDGGMPQHGHGLPTRPQVTQSLGNGDHKVDGLKFSMGGWWRMIFIVRAGVSVDTVVFNASL
jgi:YtkA-like